MIDNQVGRPVAARPAARTAFRARSGSGPDRRPRTWPRTWPGPQRMALAVTGLFFALYTLLSVRRHERMLSAGYDLGIFEQAVRAYAHGRAPIAELKGPGYNLLGDHFHPVLALLAPAYRVFPTPVTLLVAQAALMALACLPLTRWAHRTAGPVAGLVIGCAAGCSWGIVSAVAFDFHEICFAVPLLAFAVEALAGRRWRAAVLWVLPLLLVKEDLGLTVAAVGAYVAWHGRRSRRTWHLGLAVAVLGLAGTLLEMAVLLPLANPHGVFDYWHQLPGAAGSAPSTGAAVLLPLRLGWPPVKWLLLAMLAAPTAFVGLRSPLTLLCLPTLCWRLLADNVHYWQPSYHYSAVLMPIIFAGLVEVLGRRPELRSAVRLKRTLAGCAAFAVLSTVVYPLHDLVLPSTWRTSAHVRTAHALLDRIPDGVSVASSNRLAPLLVHRTTVSLVCREDGPYAAAPPDWVVADRTDPTVKTPCAAAVTARMLDAYRAAGYLTVAEQDGITVLQRPSDPRR
ncbi:DUF2079 domain-containing protein [Kitasatospora kazusensis]|uniref:DUF2079 domain-containing protein n=1 Tax=Kitasatospora kazusensis TaxID=407974 RepID=A0ABP5LS63_9ACTN